MKNIASIELLRFFSSISVVLYHYSLSFAGNNIQLIAQLPFDYILNIFYNYGSYGVQVFFTISGFVFAYIYLGGNKNISSKVFFVNRFARLYPLHLLTLLLMVFFQICNPSFFEYYTQTHNLFNDLYHFILQIFFISSWGIQEGFSFNAPIWSISVEIGVYILFFITLRYLNIYSNLLIIIIFFISHKFTIINIPYDSYAILFFLGIFVYQILKRKKNLIQMFFSLLLFSISFIGSFKILLFCPSLIMITVLLDDYISSKKIRSIFRKLGNTTYTIYLIHYPLIVLTLMFEFKFNNYQNIYLESLYLIIYFVILIFTSLLVFKYFEHPLNKYFRKKFL